VIARTRRRRLGAPEEREVEGGRLITLTPEAWERQRLKCFTLANGLCKTCRKFAPLHTTKDRQGNVLRRAGHAHHPEGRVERDDRGETLEWMCWKCHGEEHVPAKVVPKKEVVMQEVDQEITDTGAASPMPQYQCHKKVWALKITKVEHVKYDTTTDENEIVEVSFEGRFAPRRFNLLGKPRPEAGWYYVRYVGGYESFSPAKEFEEGYTRIS
jgi:hypothetical protein